jgi:hypothetical protein
MTSPCQIIYVKDSNDRWQVREEWASVVKKARFLQDSIANEEIKDIKVFSRNGSKQNRHNGDLDESAIFVFSKDVCSSVMTCPQTV